MKNCFTEYNFPAAKAINVYLNTAKSIKEANGSFFKSSLLSSSNLKLDQQIDEKFKNLRDLTVAKIKEFENELNKVNNQIRTKNITKEQEISKITLDFRSFKENCLKETEAEL